MPVRSACFDLVDREGVFLGRLCVATLPSQPERYGQAALLTDDDDEFEPVQLLEGCEYTYEVAANQRISIDKGELFIADNESGTKGRLRTGLATGRVEVTVTVGEREARPFAFEVRSSKLSYKQDYQYMLNSIAELGAELLLERFAPSEQRFSAQHQTDPETIYQRFIFLRGLLQSERLDAALKRVLATPYVQFERSAVITSPRQGIRGSGRLAYELTRPGPRMTRLGFGPGELETVPLRVQSPRTEETLDNLPNRFVKYALEEWRSLITELLDLLEQQQPARNAKVPLPVSRGLREGSKLAATVDEYLRSPIFHQVGRLSAFPLANQVLQKQEGYRDILHAYLLAQFGASLCWAGGEEVFHGGQRNVATLYEYWVFLELAKIVSGLCQHPLSLPSLVQASQSKINLVLQRSVAHSLTGQFQCNGRTFDVSLTFNQEFSRRTGGTWTRTLRPDCSLCITPKGIPAHEGGLRLHFDAKYRVSHPGESSNREEDIELTSLADDLKKMHTYRDAIIQAAGAYIIFPGNTPVNYERLGEVLPSIGAFPLRPSPAGPAVGSGAIRGFLQQVLQHVATQTTRHERWRYWQQQTASGPGDRRGCDAVPFLTAPPADTLVLLGYVKGAEHHAWIQRHGLYNLRAESSRAGSVRLKGRELAAHLVALYGRLGGGPTLFTVVTSEEPRISTAAELIALGYPSPQGQVYFCLRLQPVSQPPAWWTVERIEALLHRDPTRQPGTPAVVTWYDIATGGPAQGDAVAEANA